MGTSKKNFDSTAKMWLFAVAMLFSLASLAKAPISEGGPIGNPNDGSIKKRIPAQVQGVQIAKPLEHYMDMECQQLVNGNSKDEFIRYFTREVYELNSNFCSMVGVSHDPYGEEDQDFSQAERRTIGLGTFSKLLEGHYNEFIYNKRLEHYQDLDCQTMMNRNSNDEFIRFFAEQMMVINDSLCDKLEVNSSQLGEDSDMAQAERPIGQGTWSKIIEESYHEFNYRQ